MLMLAETLSERYYLDKIRVARERAQLQVYNLIIDFVQICICHVLQLPTAFGAHHRSNFLY